MRVSGNLGSVLWKLALARRQCTGRVYWWELFTTLNPHDHVGRVGLCDGTDDDKGHVLVVLKESAIKVVMEHRQEFSVVEATFNVEPHRSSPCLLKIKKPTVRPCAQRSELGHCCVGETNNSSYIWLTMAPAMLCLSRLTSAKGCANWAECSYTW